MPYQLVMRLGFPLGRRLLGNSFYTLSKFKDIRLLCIPNLHPKLIQSFKLCQIRGVSRFLEEMYE